MDRSEFSMPGITNRPGKSILGAMPTTSSGCSDQSYRNRIWNGALAIPIHDLGQDCQYFIEGAPRRVQPGTHPDASCQCSIEGNRVQDRAVGKQLRLVASNSGNFPMALDDENQHVRVRCFEVLPHWCVFNADGASVASLPSCGDADDIFIDRNATGLRQLQAVLDVFDARWHVSPCGEHSNGIGCTHFAVRAGA
jgi:hypothetical protein